MIIQKRHTQVVWWLILYVFHARVNSFGIDKKVLSLSRHDEIKHLANIFEFAIGCDEAGRGPLAGPVVAAACLIDKEVCIEGIIDSKATTEEGREETYLQLISNPGVKYSVIRIEHDEIDTINILEASLKAMKLATANVLKAIDIKHHIKYLALIDGNKVPSNMPIESKCVIKGDRTVYSIAAASILAKVTRDQIMTQYDKVYPTYGFAQHKGYPTLSHRSLLHQHGPCPIHRLSYRPVHESKALHDGKTKTNSTNDSSCLGAKNNFDTPIETPEELQASNVKGVRHKAARNKKNEMHSLEVGGETQIPIGKVAKVKDKEDKQDKIGGVSKRKRMDAIEKEMVMVTQGDGSDYSKGNVIDDLGEKLSESVNKGRRKGKKLPVELSVGSEMDHVSHVSSGDVECVEIKDQTKRAKRVSNDKTKP